MSTSADDLIQQLLTDPQWVALVSRQPLQPLDGDTIYPASYAPSTDKKAEQGARYCITDLGDGHNICVVDSIPSQANRIEAALLAPTYQGLIPEVRVQAALQDGHWGSRHMLELGHRATDGAVLASSLAPQVTAALQQAKRDPTALAKLAPMCLLMGVWDSRPDRTKLKLPRAFSATIEAHDVTVRRRHAQYQSAWHANELADELQKAAGKQPSQIGLDGVPAGDGLGGVVVRGSIMRSAFLASTPLRANCAIDGKPDNDTARYIAALGLVAMTMPVAPWLRTGCHLVMAEPATLDLVAVNGTRHAVHLSHADAIAAAKRAAARLDIAAVRLEGKLEAKRIAELAKKAERDDKTKKDGKADAATAAATEQN